MHIKIPIKDKFENNQKKFMLKCSRRLAFMSEVVCVCFLFTYKPNTIKPKTISISFHLMVTRYEQPMGKSTCNLVSILFSPSALRY